MNLVVKENWYELHSKGHKHNLFMDVFGNWHLSSPSHEKGKVSARVERCINKRDPREMFHNLGGQE